MGSFFWDDDFDEMCYTQHYNGRPLSVVLTEPFDPFEPQCSSFFDDIPYIESDFASLHRQHHHHHQHHYHHHHRQQQQQFQRHQRSRSSGRRYKRECYSVHYPNAHSNVYCFSPPPPPPPPPPPRRPINRVASREVLIEKIETVTIEEPVRRVATPYNVSFARSPSPPVRQLKIRPRPASCFDLRKETTDLRQHQSENRWSKHVDEHHEEHFEYQYEFHKIPDRIVPIERESPPPQPPPLPKIRLHDATTSTADLYIPPAPTPKPVRPDTKEVATSTAGLPRRPLCVTETQVIERFEKTDKVRRDSTSSTEGADDGFNGKQSEQHHRSHHRSQQQQQHRSSRKASRREFFQRMHARNGTALNLLTADERRREKARVIVRPTSKPREILVDTSGIFGFPGEFSEPSTPLTVENGSTHPSRSPFRPPDLR